MIHVSQPPEKFKKGGRTIDPDTKEIYVEEPKERKSKATKKGAKGRAKGGKKAQSAAQADKDKDGSKDIGDGKDSKNKPTPMDLTDEPIDLTRDDTSPSASS